MSNKQRLTALYERLSRDDDLEGDSYSIAGQKIMLEECAERNGFTPYRHFTDDGVTGARFDRPAFEEMMAMVEAGEIGVVIMKDLSRLGRDHLRAGLSIERFVEKGVRFIALGDAVDTDKGVDEIIAFRNIVNEMYVRDASRKSKAAHRSRGMAGKPTACLAPYGYVKDPLDKHHWLVDPEAAAVVRRIFQLSLEGHGPYQICCILSADKVEIPGYYLKQKGIGLHKKHNFPDPYRWTSSTVCNILKRKEYLGHTVNFKSKKNSYKDKKNKYVPEDEWIVFENTHEPIIDQQTFDNVQRLRGGTKRRPDGWGYVHPLTGLMYCADCGGKLYVHRVNNGKDIPKYVCGNYSKYIAQKNHSMGAATICQSPHRIDAGTVLEMITDTLKSIAKYAKEDKAAFTKMVQETLSSKQTSEVKSQKKRLGICEKRTTELELLLCKVYEDNALGKLPDKRYEVLSVQYENEKSKLEKEISSLQAAVKDFESGSERAASFIALVKRYEDFSELSTLALNEFVDKIVVHERDRKGSTDTTQTVEIHLNFIGQFAVPEEPIDPKILAELEEEQRKKIERKERLHQNYLKRKANGKQKEYEKRYNEKRKARMAERKAALFAEGAILGANSTLPMAANQ